ncbi:MAG: HAD-IIIA family hydrolase [Mailhella sp.]|nr:HAD-IIIA family hydrolase [Mailhella sp.]
MGRYAAVVFDLDGTLLDTLEDLAGSVNFALEKHAGMTRSVVQIRSFIGNGVRMLMTRSLPGGQENPAFESAFADFREHYRDHCRDKTQPYPQIMDLVKELSARGSKLAIVSNKADPEVKKLSREFFGGLICSSVGEREGVARKPAPDTLFETLKEMGVAKQDAVYVGDSEVDVQTARNAGVDFIGVTWGFRSAEQLRQAGAQTLVSSPMELLSLA